MFNYAYGLLLCLVLATPVFADDSPPSDESIQTLLELTDARKLIEGMHTLIRCSRILRDEDSDDAQRAGRLDGVDQRVLTIGSSDRRRAASMRKGEGR